MVTETTYHGIYCLYRYEINLSANSNIFVVFVPLLLIVNLCLYNAATYEARPR